MTAKKADAKRVARTARALKGLFAQDKAEGRSVQYDPGAAREYVSMITIYGAGKMTVAQRRKIARWMRSRADWFEEFGGLATDGRFTQKYMK